MPRDHPRRHTYVSILVVVDGTLKHRHQATPEQSGSHVSILVVVDGTLKPQLCLLIQSQLTIVSILVVVDGTLKHSSGVESVLELIGFQSLLLWMER